MAEAAWTSLGLLFSWPYILYPIAGTLLSMLFAALPGVSGATLMALAMPLVYSMEPTEALLLFGAFVGGGTFMGSVSAILVGIPGKDSNAATVLDGYPMAQQGLAKTAIGCSAAASALGSTLGVAALLALLPYLREAVLLFGPTEFLALGLWGITTVALAAQGSWIRGFGAAALGFLLTLIGVDPRSGETRFTFGSLYLHDGLDFVLIFLGVFSLAEVIGLLTLGRRTISGKDRLEELRGSVWDGVRAVFANFRLFVQSSSVGAAVGMIPGVGGMIAGFAAYGLAVRTVSDGNFGNGDIRGVLAPEAANDAKDGGALAPALVFGIPSDSGTAMLLVALTQMGVAPGRELLDQHLDYVFLLVVSLFFSNWLTSLLGLALVRPFAWLTVAPARWLGLGLMALTIVGAFAYRRSVADLLVVSLFGLLGHYMKRYGWSRVALVAALVLGPLIETNLLLSLRLHELGRVSLLERPITLLLAGLTAASWCGIWAQSVRRRET